MLRAQVLHNLQVLVSKGGRHRAVYRFASRHASNTICQIIKWLLQHMLQIPFRLQPWASESCIFASNLQMPASKHKQAKYCTQMLLHREMLIHKDAFTHGFFTDSFSQRNVFLFSHRRLHIQVFLPRDAFGHKYLLRASAFTEDAFEQRSFCTQTRRYFRAAFTLHTRLYTQNTQRCFYTEIHLHRGVFLHTHTNNPQILLQRITKMCFRSDTFRL